MAYKVIILYRLYMPSYFLGTFTEYPYGRQYQSDSNHCGSFLYSYVSCFRYWISSFIFAFREPLPYPLQICFTFPFGEIMT